MLSAVLKRVRSVEKRLEKQANNIEELRYKIRGPLTTESDKISSVGDIKEILLRYQAKLKEQGFEMNQIKSKITAQEENVQKIKLDLIKLRSEKQRMQQDSQQQQLTSSREQPIQDLTQFIHNTPTESPQLLGRGGTYQGETAVLASQPTGNYLEGQPLFPEAEQLYNQGSHAGDHSRSTEVIVAERCLHESGSDSAALWHNFTNNKLRMGTPIMSGIDLLMQEQYPQEQTQMYHHRQVVKKPSGELFNTVNSNAVNFHREVSILKRRVAELEAECMQKDKLLQELASKQEEYKEREKEFLHKLEWCEHKMRLLKQDKRRRGETIGKLLRSIDEMKDVGKLDLSRVQEGRGILATTLNTRGLSNEQRIQAAISIMDTEKVPRYRELLSRVRTSESSTHSGSDETDSEANTPRHAGAQK